VRPDITHSSGQNRTDVAVIGAGLAGCCTAAALARAGLGVTLIDAMAIYPPAFRAEEIDDSHLAVLERFGLRQAVLPVLTPMDDNVSFRFGRLFSRRLFREYGFAYGDLINALRPALPAQVRQVIGRVERVETGPERQIIGLADGTVVEARLLVIATGLGDAVRRAVGVERIVTSKAHSLSLGFTMARPRSDYAFEKLTCFSHRPEDRIAYLTLFPLGEALRANFFIYRTMDDPWVTAFRQDPQPLLRAAMPELAELCHGFEVTGTVAARPMDLTVSEGYRRDGLVLVGDAFSTVCPVPGIGVRKALSDVERLCVHAPRWLETPGMDAGKVAAFYDDPAKRATDDECMHTSLVARSTAVDTSLRWRARRQRNALARRGIYAANKLLRRIDGWERDLQRRPAPSCAPA